MIKLNNDMNSKSPQQQVGIKTEPAESDRTVLPVD